MNEERNHIDRGDKITVLLVDDHFLVRRGFRRILEDDPHITVVREAGSGEQGVELASQLQPKVVLMDCAMPGTNGITAAREIAKKCPTTFVAMLSMHSEGFWVRHAFNVGARGFILKGAIDLDLAVAVEPVASGEFLFDPAIARRSTGRRDLTVRELQILQLIVNGKSNREIAAKLVLSVNTVAVHRSRIMAAAGVRKTADLIVHSITNNLVSIF